MSKLMEEVTAAKLEYYEVKINTLTAQVQAQKRLIEAQEWGMINIHNFMAQAKNDLGLILEFPFLERDINRRINDARRALRLVVLNGEKNEND